LENLKFSKNKFGTLKVQVSVRQIRFRRKFRASDLRAYFAAFVKNRGEFIAVKAKSDKMS